MPNVEQPLYPANLPGMSYDPLQKPYALGDPLTRTKLRQNSQHVMQMIDTVMMIISLVIPSLEPDHEIYPVKTLPRAR